MAAENNLRKQNQREYIITYNIGGVIVVDSLLDMIFRWSIGNKFIKQYIYTVLLMLTPGLGEQTPMVIYLIAVIQATPNKLH